MQLGGLGNRFHRKEISLMKLIHFVQIVKIPVTIDLARIANAAKASGKPYRAYGQI